MKSLFDIQEKVALITGASSGLGHHFAHLLASRGAKVMLAARRTQRLESATGEIRSANGTAQWVEMDVTNSDSIKSGFEKTLQQFGSVDIVINNAGVAENCNALDVSEELWDYTVNTNLKGAWLVAQQAGKAMSASNRGGVIVNICSILGRSVMGGVTPYSAAKAGLEHLTRTLAFEWARYNIRVNAIAPGYIVTEINREFLESSRSERALKKIPQRRFGQPEDLDGTVLLLVSNASAYMTGSVIVVDGGHTQTSI